MQLYSLFLGMVLLFAVTTAQAQVADTTEQIELLVVDSLEKVSEKATWPVPKHALLWSIIPGGGHVYNKKYWKVIPTYGALGYLAWRIDYNQTRYRKYRDALKLLQQGQDNCFTGSPNNNIQTLANLRDRYDKRTQQMYAYTVIAYGLQGIWAYVDAHLMDFDISDDLSLSVQPSLTPTPFEAPAAGIGMSIQFKPREVPAMPAF